VILLAFAKQLAFHIEGVFPPSSMHPVTISKYDPTIVRRKYVLPHHIVNNIQSNATHMGEYL